LPEKSQAYINTLRRLETAYAMFSVNLDEALGFRRGGRPTKAYQALSVTPALCHKLSNPLLGVLRGMLRHARHFGVTPNFLPLDPENFQNAKSQRVARMNALFSRIFLTRKSQFVYKITALAEMVEELARDFHEAAAELMDGASARPDHEWEILDASHYDLNTCLRESAVLLKSFLHALPEKQLEEFHFSLEQLAGSPSPVATRSRHLAHRRMALLKGQ
jgi:hypothetical protein